MGIPREKFVVISGIGCSSRFPYYMNTYGFHTIHGRAPTVATGVKVANPDLSVWMITGDGDGLSIGGNHLLHVIRRNLDINILLFNNKIYGLTKGQYSPTSESGKRTKTSPLGSIEHPLNPLCFALASEGTFVARTMDTNPKHMAEIFGIGAKHKGTSFIEIFQNCVIFNNLAWDDVSGRQVRDDRLLMLEHGKPLVFGKEKNKGIRLSGSEPEIVTIGENGITLDDIIVHDAHNPNPSYAYMLTQMNYPDFPTPIGVFRDVNSRAPYDKLVEEQVKSAIQTQGRGTIQKLLKGQEYWEVTGEGPKTQSTPIVKKASNTEEMDIMREQHDEKALSKKPILKVLKKKIAEAMLAHGTQNIISVAPKDTLAHAIHLFKEKKIGCIPVMEKDKLVGILSERDIILKVVLQSVDRDHATVDTVMTIHPETLTDANSIADAINKLASGGFRHLPIENKGKVGLISVKGLVNFIYDNVYKN